MAEVYKISATYKRRRFQDSGKDQAPDYYVYEFIDIVDSENKSFSNKWFKETKLISEANLIAGKRYEIVLSEKPHFPDAVNLPFPKEISWDDGKIFIKNGNAIIKVDKNGKETNLSENTLGQEIRKWKMELRKKLNKTK